MTQNTQLTNKDGIVIKPGQWWTSPDGVPCRVVALDMGRVVCRDESEGVHFSTDPSAPTLGTLTKSHDGAYLKAARADGWCVRVEGMEIPNTAELERKRKWDTTDSDWSDCLDFKPYLWLTDATYIYKLKADEPAQPERPKYKLFEVFRTDPHKRLMVRDKSGVIVNVGTCPILDDHTLFGFTDNPDWVQLTERLENSVESYEPTPCDHTGTRRFAIGRLEV